MNVIKVCVMESLISSLLSSSRFKRSEYSVWSISTVHKQYIITFSKVIIKFILVMEGGFANKSSCST